jgi:uncharacterized ion transporter superfamily protein YfcC
MRGRNHKLISKFQGQHFTVTAYVTAILKCGGYIYTIKNEVLPEVPLLSGRESNK